MIQLGKMQKLRVVRKSPKGYYLKSKQDDREIFLPQSKNIEGKEFKLDDNVNVFVYKDSDDMLICTTKKPKVVIGDLAELEVIEVTKFGAFLDWGLDKDLFLPFKEQKGKVQKGSLCLVGLYVDKSDRLCATMDINKLLKSDSPFRKNDMAYGTVYSVNQDLGAFVAVENKYHGLIPKHELFTNIKCGDHVEVRVSQVREDGKLNLSLRKNAYKQIDEDLNIILQQLNKSNGFLKLNDKSDPDLIKKQLGISKAAFKRAVGRLLKQGKIEFIKDGIKLK